MSAALSSFFNKSLICFALVLLFGFVFSVGLIHAEDAAPTTAKESKEQENKKKNDQNDDGSDNKKSGREKPVTDEGKEKEKNSNKKKDEKQGKKAKPKDSKKDDAIKGKEKANSENNDSKTIANENTEKEQNETELKKEEKQKEERKPETLELKKEQLRLTSKLTGTFESKRSETVRLKGEVFTTFELLEVVPHGTKIRKGDVLIKFDPQKYDEAFTERKRALRLSEISLKEEEIAFKYLEKRRPLQKEAIERNQKHEEEDFVYFFNVEQDMMKKMFGFTVKVYQFYLDSAKEELRQLEKMYEADDLVEDTEEFILKRSKFMVEAQQFMFERSKVQADYMKDVMLHRMEESMRQGAKLSRYEYEMSKETFDFTFEQARLKLEKTKETHAKLVEQHEKFVKDKQMLTLKAPCDGIVYYGEYNSKLSPGKWNGASTVAGAMKIGESVSNKTVLFTVVDPKPSRIRATVGEKELHWIDVGTRGTVAPTAFPDVRYQVRVVERDTCPTAANNFVAIMSVDLPEDGKVFPAMTGAVELVVYDKKETVMVPTAAIKREEMENDSWNHAYLYVYEENKTVDKIKVKTGQVKGEKTEILSGFQSGNQVFKTFSAGEKWIEDEKERKEKEEKERKEVKEKKSNNTKKGKNEAKE